MFRAMRNNKKALSQDMAEKLLQEGEYGVLATVGEDGYPYALPISYAYENNFIYLHGATVGHKLDNIAFNSKVSFTVVGDTEVLGEKFSSKYKSVVVFGQAQCLEGEEKKEALMALVRKYSSEFMASGEAYINRAINNVSIIKIIPEHISAKGRLE